MKYLFWPVQELTSVIRAQLNKQISVWCLAVLHSYAAVVYFSKEESNFSSASLGLHDNNASFPQVQVTNTHWSVSSSWVHPCIIGQMVDRLWIANIVGENVSVVLCLHESALWKTGDSSSRPMPDWISSSYSAILIQEVESRNMFVYSYSSVGWFNRCFKPFDQCIHSNLE